ncbi:sigma-54-dependent Fis family transcriptional regulator [bacterium]|nr:sigma-54-dependent Fis family transcriptional regulator [candidate division CSSED10-310 bacterium]
MENLQIQIIAQKDRQAILRDVIQPFNSVRFSWHLPATLADRLAASTNHTVTLIWIDAVTLHGLQRVLAGTDSDGIASGIIGVGSQMTARDAIHLGQLGISRFFDLPADSELLIGELMEWYQAAAAPAPGSRSGLSIDDVMIGGSPAILELRSLIRKVAPRDKLMILLRGETGTGKGLIARMLHQMSPRRDKPFVEINCTAIPEGLVEAELFGHEKGAFTDAHRSRRGIFELAHGGTLFLDEIGYLKTEVQVKLLKVLEDRRFRRVGGEKDVQVDCRILAGTSVNLEEQVASGHFRQDLYYRLNVFPIVVPPLRDRGADILELAEYFRSHFCREHGIQTGEFDAGAQSILLAGAWPGNVRELKHSVERAVILCEHLPISPDALGLAAPISESTAGESPLTSVDGSGVRLPVITIPWPRDGRSMDDIQKAVIERVLELTGGNRSEAARQLRISRSRLLRRIGSEDDE